MKLSIALAVPILIIFGGVLLLLGCLPVPATQQLQPNLKPKPDFLIGTNSDRPIQLYQTKIDDAFIVLSKHIGTPPPTKSMSAGHWVLYEIWSVSPDRRRFAAHYPLRTATWVAPLCFHAEPEIAERWLVLDVASDGTVTHTQTVDEQPFQPQPWVQWGDVFDAPTRQKLYNAGVFPSDEEFNAQKDLMRQRFLRSQILQQERSTQPTEGKP
jgi:hypothetical protein